MEFMGQNVKKMAQGSLRSWTMWLAVMLAILGVLQLEDDHMREFLPPEAYGIFHIVLGCVIAALRIITTMPLQDKAPQ